MSGDIAFASDEPSPTSWFEASTTHFFCLGGAIVGHVRRGSRSYWQATTLLPGVRINEDLHETIDGAKAAVELAMHIWLEAAGLQLPGTGQ